MNMVRWLSIVLFACGAPGSNAIDDEPVNAVTSCPEGSTLTYENFGEAFFAAHCLECHAGRASPSLRSQPLIESARSRIRAQAVTSKRMPQGRSLASSERAKLAEWLACGAP
jgi:uncharacterized membrane protein